MRVFKNAWFERFARKEQLTDASLYEAIQRAEKGLIDADLGGSVIKQRVARPGQGKSGSYRTLIVYRQGTRAFFVYGFAKSDKSSISREEKAAFKQVAQHVLALSDEHLNELVDKGQFVEVSNE